MDNILIIVVAIVGIGIAIVITLGILIGMIVAWPLTLILIMLGGFTFGGAGALIGAAISGVLGVFVCSDL